MFSVGTCEFSTKIFWWVWLKSVVLEKMMHVCKWCRVNYYLAFILLVCICVCVYTASKPQEFRYLFTFSKESGAYLEIFWTTLWSENIQHGLKYPGKTVSRFWGILHSGSCVYNLLCDFSCFLEPDDWWPDVTSRHGGQRSLSSRPTLPLLPSFLPLYKRLFTSHPVWTI